ncbi:MAG: oligosaccharide flippase family protein [Bacteroidetes bacterium]|nr:oligosaccharide flippase family protein [Bacteroidota bacterium]MCL2302548.1 oligosaccharide flippase family protein [Lentimicrobiaceae bacterium]
MYNIKTIKAKIHRSEFGKNILTLSSGTALAQVIPFLFYPIIARIFTPAEFGLLATLTAIITIITEFSSGKYELGILIAKTKRDAVNLVGLTLFLSFLILAFIYLILQLFLADFLSQTLHESQLKQWLFICPIAAFSIIIYNTYNEWCVRNGYFKKLAINKIVNASAITLSKLFLGFVKVFSQGLVMGDVIGRLISAGVCVFRAMQKDAAAFKEISIVRIKKVAKEFIEFPKFIMPGRLLNVVGQQLPVLFLGFYFNSVVVGYFSMTMLVFSVPVNVISFAVRDVFRQRANEEFKNTGNCRSIYIKVLKILSIIAIIGAIFLILLLPFIFSIFLGEQWTTAAYYAQILTIPTLLSFVASPLFDVLIITNRLKINLLWQIYYAVITFLSLWIGCVLYNNVIAALYFFAIGRGSAYLLSIILSHHYAKGNLLKIKK